MGAGLSPGQDSRRQSPVSLLMLLSLPPANPPPSPRHPGGAGGRAAPPNNPRRPMTSASPGNKLRPRRSAGPGCPCQAPNWAFSYSLSPITLHTATSTWSFRWFRRRSAPAPLGELASCGLWQEAQALGWIPAKPGPLPPGPGSELAAYVIAPVDTTAREHFCRNGMKP
jgi:hypothetical protein